MINKFDLARLDGFTGTAVEFYAPIYEEAGLTGARASGFDGHESELQKFIADRDSSLNETLEADQKALKIKSDIAEQLQKDDDFVRSITGRDGLDAFEVAKSAGFEGERDDWLASLTGADGASAYELALLSGFDGSESEWLAKMVGEQGLSAYDLWLSVGNNGSLTDFLASLKGKKGDNGDKGDQGDKGDPGDKGGMGEMPRHQWDGTRIRFEQSDGRWGQWVDVRGATGAPGSGGGAGSLSLHRFYDGFGEFPTPGKEQILYFDTSTDPYSVYVWADGAYQSIGGGGGGEVAPTGEAMGFENRTDSTLSVSETQLTISGAYNVWVRGVKYAKTAPENVTLAEGLNYIGYGAGGTLQISPTYFNFSQVAPAAIVYKNGAQVRLFEERHGITMDWATHQYLHLTRGAAYSSGFDVGNFTTTGNGSLDAHAQFGLSGGVFFDEDIRLAITSGTLADFRQPLEGIAELPVAYKIGTKWVFDAPTQFAVKPGTSGRISFNQNTGGTFSLADVQNNHYGVMFIVATNAPENPVISIMGQGSYGESAAADASFYSDLDLLGFPTQEFRPLFKVVFRTANSFANAVKARIHTITDLRAIDESGFGVTAVPYEQSVRKSFETVSKNLDATDAVFNYTSGELTSIVYASGVTKTLNYTSGDLTSVVLSGATPDGIELTQTRGYTAGELTSITYS